MDFRCVTKDDEWDGSVVNLKKHNNYYEFWIHSRSSIMTIIGTTSRGNFACFPDFNVGCHLVNLKDSFWNTEKLIGILGKIDGLTVAVALYNLADEVNL